MTQKQAAAWIVGLAVIVGGFWLVTSWPTITGLRKCDTAIQDKLKAPSTYKRIDYISLRDGFLITYEADNALGVPIRGKGTCDIYGNMAVWHE